MEDVIEIVDLEFGYGDQQVIKGISLTIPRGKYTTIIGHNGSGKSTLAKLITGLEEKQSGEIKVDGIVLSEQTVYQIRSRVGIVFQNPDNQFIGSTVEDDIAFGLENQQIKPSDMQDMIVTYASIVGMENYLHKEPTHLSGGQKQRVAIASVLALKQDVVILDEATSMLDPTGKQDIQKLVRQLNEEEGKTVISITHDIEEAVNSDYVVILNEGQVYKTGIPEALLGNLQELESIGLEGSFALTLSSKLVKQGVLKKPVIKLEELKEILWQLNLNT